MCSPTWETHIPSDLCSPTQETHFPNDMCSPTWETHIPSDMCSPTQETLIPSDMCSPTWETHTPSDMCFPTWETHIPSDMCSPTQKTLIPSDVCSPIQKKISLVICVPLPGKQFHWVARLQAKLNLRLQLEIKGPKLLGHVNSSYLLINRCWTGYHVLFNVEIGHSICLRMLNENRAGLCSFPQVLTLSIESWPTLFFCLLFVLNTHDLIAWSSCPTKGTCTFVVCRISSDIGKVWSCSIWWPTYLQFCTFIWLYIDVELSDVV